MTILATSREPLHVPGEATFSLPTLPAPDPGHDLAPDALSGYPAVRLFVARAIDARSDFALTPQNAAAVTRICYDLDGIPLALELAAARIRSMSAVAIAGHLTDRFTLLKGGDRTALPRQQTLRATIDWSYDLLAPPERALLQRLSVFAGGFALDGAEAIGAGGDISSAEVLDALDHLIDKSLVAFDAQNERYKLLETVRQYARERLAEVGRGSEQPRPTSALLRRACGACERQAPWAEARSVDRPPRCRAREHPARVRSRTDRVRRWRGGFGDGLRVQPMVRMDSSSSSGIGWCWRHSRIRMRSRKTWRAAVRCMSPTSLAA